MALQLYIIVVGIYLLFCLRGVSNYKSNFVYYITAVFYGNANNRERDLL